MITEHAGKYYITMYYDNEYNHADGIINPIKTSGAFSRSSACCISCYLPSLDTAGKTATGE